MPKAISTSPKGFAISQPLVRNNRQKCDKVEEQGKTVEEVHSVVVGAEYKPRV